MCAVGAVFISGLIRRRLVFCSRRVSPIRCRSSWRSAGKCAPGTLSGRSDTSSGSTYSTAIAPSSSW
jgi:hypothetical protein